jgi:hypothetical protein
MAEREVLIVFGIYIYKEGRKLGNGDVCCGHGRRERVNLGGFLS